ncbi:MAG: hypothetical protein JWP81_3134 [Ferruginibacter sp.]|nr:hypothetical protein [Ferruginibacter sp.]
METKADILYELNFLSPLIAAMEKKNVFRVPEGYFESVSDTVLICLQEENELHNPLEEKVMANVPTGYFDNLPATILDRIKAGETAKEEISNLSSVLYGIQNKNVFEVPDGYFESIPTHFFYTINSAANEIKEHSPLLYDIKSKNVFEIPVNYFTHLPDAILTKAKAQTAKVVSMQKRSWPKRNLLRYAIAAMFMGVMALGVYKFIDKPINTTALASLDASIEKGKNMNEEQFNETIQNLTEADIAKYLEANGDIADMALLRGNLQDVSLPSQEDYLLDGATLDKYLKEIEKTTPGN